MPFSGGESLVPVGLSDDPIFVPVPPMLYVPPVPKAWFWTTTNPRFETTVGYFATINASGLSSALKARSELLMSLDLERQVISQGESQPSTAVHRHTKTVCVGHLAAEIFTSTPMVKIPQELIDTIIEEIPLSDSQYPFVTYRDESDESTLLVETLRACALVSRAFVRPTQRRLFHAVGLDLTRKGDHSNRRFSQLLLDRPHLRTYVRHLQLTYTSANDDAELISQILSSLTCLGSIKLQGRGFEWSGQPRWVKASLLAALSRPNLRHIALVEVKFTSASELHAVLKNCVGMKQLELLGIQFVNHEGLNPDTTTADPCTPSILLDSVVLLGLDSADVDSVLQAFTAIDITHLRFLKLIQTAPENILRANVSTVQRVEILFVRHDGFGLVRTTSNYGC
ncbi:hypothetical protein DFH06DRAFT_1369225 [Mycena polygramma]|nr:hypothetical protein DFH06DRAFT_1369225 [Mycena polygramma]